MPVNSFENYPMSWKPVISDRKGAIYTDIVNIGLHFILKNVRPYAASCSEA